MDLDLDALRARTFKVKLGGTEYEIPLASMKAYIEMLALRKELSDDDAETNLGVLKRMVQALAPQLPVDDLNPAELNIILERLDKFNAGAAGGESGNPAGA